MRRARIGDVDPSSTPSDVTTIQSLRPSSAPPLTPHGTNINPIQSTAQKQEVAASTTRFEKKAAPIIGDSIQKVASQLLVTNSTDKQSESLNRRNNKPLNLPEQKVHAGVAVPITMEELERELAKTHQQATTNSGLSTWVLLSGVHTTTTAKIPTKKNKTASAQGRPTITMVTRRIPAENVTPKPYNASSKITVHSSPALTKIKASILAESLRDKTTEKPVTQSAVKGFTKRTTAATSPSPSTTTKKIEEMTTIPSSDIITTFSSIERKDNTVDLYIESREATTKKPKRPSQANTNKRKKTNKNRRRPTTEKPLEIESKTKNATKTALAKKPISTQIYNYLSREVMPSVGVGLVGLMVTAGLTYFLYPFSGLRRSYTIDRKDDLYRYNTDELATADGQSEEEVFGKVIAGMPANKLYPTPNQQPYGNSQPMPYNRINRVGQVNHQQQIKRPVYRNMQPYYQNNQGHIYPESISYNTHESVQPVQPLQNIEQRTADLEIDAKPSEHTYDESNFKPMDDYKYQQNIQEPKFEPIVQTTVKAPMSTKVATSTSTQQFVVGNIPKELLEPSIVPEHGPRRRRDVDDQENDIDNEIIPGTVNNYDSEEVKDIATSTTTTKPVEIVNIIEHRDVPTNETKEVEDQQMADVSMTEDVKEEAEVEPEYRPTNETNSNLMDFIRQLINFKLRLGLGILQRTTEALSRYLHGTPVDRSTPRVS